MTEIVPFRAPAPENDQVAPPEPAQQAQGHDRPAPRRFVPPVSSRPSRPGQIFATLPPRVRAGLAALPPAVQRWLGKLAPEVQQALADMDEPVQLQIVQALSDVSAQHQQRRQLTNRPASGPPAAAAKTPPITVAMAREFADFLLGHTGPPVWIAKAKVETPASADRALVPYNPEQQEAQREAQLLAAMGERRKTGLESELADLRKQRPVSDSNDKQVKARNDHLDEHLSSRGDTRRVGFPVLAERRRREQRQEFEQLRAGHASASKGADSGAGKSDATGTGVGLASEPVDTGSLTAQLTTRRGTISAAMQAVNSQLKRRDTTAYLAAARKHPEDPAGEQAAAFDRAIERNDWLTADRVLKALVAQASAAMAQANATLAERKADRENAGSKNLPCHRPPGLRPARLAAESDHKDLDWIGLRESLRLYLEQVDLALGARARFEAIQNRIPNITDGQLSANLAKFVEEHQKLPWEKVVSSAHQDKYSLLHLENSLDQYQDAQSRKEIEAKKKGMNAQTRRALEIYEDMKKQYQQWDGTMRNRGAWWGSNRPGDRTGARTIDTALLPIIKGWAERAGWEQKESRSAGISYHRGRGGIDFIYHSRDSE